MDTATSIPELDFMDTRKAMDLLFAADVPVIIKSKPGQGKTSLVQQYARDKGPDYGLFEVNCALANQPDFMGWFYKVTETHANYDGQPIEIEAGRYTYPYFLFDKRTGRPAFQFKHGVVVFEEYGQTDQELKRALGQTFLEKRVGQHLLPQAFDIVALSNYDTDRSAVGKDFDFLINRRGELHLKNSVDGFLVFAHEHDFLPMSMAFASIETHGVFAGETPKDQGPFLTPRSMELLDRFMRVVVKARIDFNDPLVRVTASGIVGAGAAHQYITYTALRDKIPTVAQIVKSPEKTRVPDDTDQQMFVIFNMADKASKENIGQLVRYMKRLPQDMSVAFYRNALMRDKSLMSCTEFGDWAVENKALLAIVNSRF